MIFSEQLKSLYKTGTTQSIQHFFFCAYLNERVCQRWLGIMGVESSPERTRSNLHSSTITRTVERGLVRSHWGTLACTTHSDTPLTQSLSEWLHKQSETARQLCSGRSKRRQIETDVLLVSALSSPLSLSLYIYMYQPAAPTLSPGPFSLCSPSLLKSLSYTHT